MAEYERIYHAFEPVFDADSEILILGTMPSVQSREAGFYYGHPRNRFWKIIADITGNTSVFSVEEKRKLLLDNKIALWDVLKSCDIIGSGDNSIKNPEPNDMSVILQNSKVTKIFTNGRKADELYKKYCKTGIQSICLPSTSPANAAWDTKRLTEIWREEIVFTNL